MSSMIEAHFCGIASQSSIYGLTSLCAEKSSHKVLVASSKRKVYCIEYSKNKQSVIFSTREVQFTYIPGKAEIISIDAFSQICHIHDFVVGITFTKSDKGGKQTQYFNVYSSSSELTPSTECDLDSIAQGCWSIGLDFIPFHLTHTELYLDGNKEMVWLLSGNDCKIHLYREDKDCQTYNEESSDKYFPEFKELSNVVMWMDFITTCDSRLTALGCRDGSVIVTHLALQPEIAIKSSWKVQHDGPISTVKLFKDSSLQRDKSKELKFTDINLFVGNTLEVSVVYRGVLSGGGVRRAVLPRSEGFDCVTCGLLADIDMDGQHELLLGTYGQQLLVYKWRGESYELSEQRHMPSPVLALSYVDIVGDGIRELLVLTTRGLHILQHDLKAASELCLSRLEWLLENLSTQQLKEFAQCDI